jgi:glycogen debranching enzyme
MTAEGAIEHDWTTPDRAPHRHMWLWDSAFHAFGLRHIAPEWAVESIRAVLSTQRPDGWISHSTRPDGVQSKIANPSLLGWAAWNVYEEHPDRDFISEALPSAGDYLKHNMTGQRPGGPDLGWLATGNETGMDNSPRFDGRPDGILSVDMNAYAVNESEFLALIAMELGLDDAANEWRTMHDEWSDFVRETFWDDQDRFFYDRAADGSWIRVRTVAGFMPMFAGIATEEQAAALVERLVDDNEFWRAFPVSTVSAREPSFSADMWRGPTWVNTNYLVAIGLDRYGYRELAREIREASLQEIARWYRKTGVIWEYYDSEGIRSPAELPRKGRTGGAWIHRVVRDYHWTSALAIDLLRTRSWWG